MIPLEMFAHFPLFCQILVQNMVDLYQFRKNELYFLKG